MNSINLIQLINNKIHLNQKALQQLSQHLEPISIIVACGQYRTGKSFLLNSLFYDHCFDVSSTTQPCTKGINMIKQPIKHDGTNIWIFDTQGFGSLQKDSKHDAKIFLLSLLISDIFIYNSIGAIDQISISKIAMICREIENLMQLHTNNYQHHNFQVENLIRDVKFYWILRDFSLTLVDGKGKVLDSDEYLEQSLQGNNRKSPQQRKIIRKMFKQRHCTPLVRPCISQKALNQLSQNTKNQTIRIQFQQQIKKLKISILSHITPKIILGNQVNGKQFCQLIKFYIKMINQSDYSIGLNTTWEQIQTHQRQVIISIIQEQYKNKFLYFQKILPISADQFDKLQKQLITILNSKINPIKYNSNQYTIIISQIQQIKSSLKIKLISKNNYKIKQKSDSYLYELFKQLQNNINIRSQYHTFRQQFLTEIKKFKKNFQNKFKIYQKSITYQSYIQILQKIINQFIIKFIQKLQTDTQIKSKQIQQLKKIKKYSQNQILQLMIDNQKIEKQLQRTKIQYDESLRDIINYVQIIQRLQKVTQNLKTQFKHLQQSSHSTQATLQQKLSQLQQLQKKHHQQLQHTHQQLQTQLQSNKAIKQQLLTLRKQHKTLKDTSQNKQQHLQQQLKNKVQGLLTILNNQRQHFQQLIIQKNTQHTQLTNKIKQKQQVNNKLKSQYLQDKNIIKHQYDTILSKQKLQFQHQILKMKQIILSLQSNIKSLTNQNQKISIQSAKYLQQYELKTTKCTQMWSKIQLLQKYNQDKDQYLTQQIQTQKQYRKQTKKQRQQLVTKLSQIQQNYRLLKQKHKTQLSNINKNMQLSLLNQTQNNKNQCQILKQQFDLQKQTIANKLAQAAQRITKMHNNQIKLNQKIYQYQQQIKSFTSFKQSNKKQDQFQNHQLQQNISIKNDINQKIHSLTQQNSTLKQQLSQCQQKLQKFNKQSFKYINFHAYMKKHAKQPQKSHQYKQNILNKSFNDSSTIYTSNYMNIDYIQKIALKQQTIQSLHQKISTYIHNQQQINKKIHELDLIVIDQQKQIQNYHQQQVNYINQITSIKQEKQIMRNKLESKIAQYVLNNQRLRKELAALHEKSNHLTKQTELWKIKASQLQDRQKMKTGNKNSSYKQKIDNLFNKL